MHPPDASAPQPEVFDFKGGWSNVLFQYDWC